MIIDYKYHIASLAAVFLALALGILIGSSLIGSDTLLKKQESLIASLQKQYDSLRSENRQKGEQVSALKLEASRQDSFNQNVLPVLVKNKLQGVRVAVVDLSYSKDHDKLIELLGTAGADVTSVTSFNSAMLKDQSVSSAVAEAVGKGAQSEPADYLPDVAGQLAFALTNSSDNPLIKDLKDIKILQLKGKYGADQVQDLVLIGGSNSNALNFSQSLDLVLAADLKKSNVKVYGVEDSDVTVSYMQAYQKAQLITVDDIDYSYGQLALVEAMSGYPGHYGIKSTADAFLPPL